MRYKGIVHNVLGDAPFIGALVIANHCSMPCPDCLNEHLKDDMYCRDHSAGEIIEQVKANGLNEGVILSGLEWSEQPDDLAKLAWKALEEELEVIVYTHLEEEAFFDQVPNLIGAPILVKFGLYDKNLKADDHWSFGVQLATSNQHIKRFGPDDHSHYSIYR